MFEVDPRVRLTFWNQAMAGAVFYGSLVCVSQGSVQRSQTLRSTKSMYL